MRENERLEESMAILPDEKSESLRSILDWKPE